MRTNNYYKILGVPPHATQDEIVKAFRLLVKKYHPDVSKIPNAEERMKVINNANDVLSDPEKRRQFDEEREIPESPPVRRERHRRRSERTRYQPPRYEQPPSPAQPQQYKWDMPNPAGLFVFILILVFMWVGIPQTIPYEPHVASPVDPPVVILVTPQPVVTVQKTFEIWKGEGDALRGQQRNGDALAAYDRALEIRPDASGLWVTEGDIYSTMGNFEKAITCYDQALKTNPQVGERVQKKSWVLTNINSLMEYTDRLIEQEDYPAAIDICDDILSAGIRNTNFQKRVLSAKVYALMRSGRFDEANRVTRSIESV